MTHYALVPIEAPKTNVMLQRLGVIYGVPESTDPQAFVAEYARMMRQYVDSELEEAAERLLQTRKYKSWPTIAECINALENVRAGRRNKELAAKLAAEWAEKAKPKTVSPEEQRAAEQFVDDCADGKIDLGFCAAQLRAIAIRMRERRRAAR